MTDQLTPEQWELRRQIVLERLAFLNAMYPTDIEDDGDHEPDTT